MSPAQKPRGVIDLGGAQRSRRRSSEARPTGSPGMRTPPRGRARGRRGGADGGAARVCGGGRRGDQRAGGRRGRVPGGREARRPARSPRRGTCPAGRAPLTSPPRLERELGTTVPLSTTSRFPGRGVPARGRQALGRFSEFSGVRGSAAGSILDGKPWLGRGAAAEIGHMVVEDGRGQVTCGRRGCMEGYAGRGGDGGKARARRWRTASKTDLFKLMKKHNKDRLTSGIWERALDHGQRTSPKS